MTAVQAPSMLMLPQDNIFARKERRRYQNSSARSIRSLEVSSFLDLPDDVIGLLIPLLSQRDQHRLRGVCRALRATVEQSITTLDLTPGGRIRTAENAIAIATRFCNLQHLTMRSFGDMADSHIQTLATRCPLLCTLVLDDPRPHHGVIYVCKQITDVALWHLARNCKQLHTLKARCCQITDAGLLHIAQNCPQLHVLDINRCKQITDTGLAHLSRGCPSLEILDIRYCHQVTDAGLRQLAQGCRQLTALNVKYCYQLTDAGLQTLSQGCTKLQTLNVSYCWQITDSVCV